MKKLLYASVLFFTIAISCTKSDLPPVGKGNFIELTLSSSISSVTLNSAVISIKYIDPNATSIIERGICWSTSTLPTVSNSKATITGTGSSGLTSNVTITGLTHSTKYYFRYYVKNNVGVFYSNEIAVTTLTAQKAVLTTTTAGSLTTNSAVSGGVISSDGNTPVTQRGVCYSTSSGPTISNSFTSNGTGIGTFTSPISGLAPGTTYYVRAYATNLAGTSYGNEVSFTTVAISKPTLTTLTVTNVNYNSASSGGIISSNGNATILQSGVCYSTSPTPTISNANTTDGTASGTYISQITGLNPGTKYYVRAYATNAAGTAYGNETSFSTPVITKPSLSTTTITSINGYSVYAASSVSSDGNAAVQVSGFCYSTSPNPNIANSKTTDGSLNGGSYTSQISGLNPSTTYYIRSYATNAAGTGYGLETSFTTPSVSAPSVTTILSTYTSSTAIVSGTINSDGNAPITQSGVCYSTSPNPTIANSRTTDGQSAGSWSSNISGLSPSTTYYAKAYATNAVNTSYGNQVTFTTSAAPVVCSITGTTNGVWYTMATSGSNTYSVGSNFSIRFNSSAGYNYTFGQAADVALYLNETKVGSYGTSLSFTLGVTQLFPIPSVTPSSCYTLRVFKAEAGGAIKVYVSPRFTIN